LGLLLDDAAYRVLHVDVTLAEGAKSGQILLALPADGQGQRPATVVGGPDKGTEMVFRVALGEQVMASDAVLQAVLARVTMSLQAVMALRPGDPVPLGSAALTRIDLEGADGCRVGGGKLGQNRGMRAVRFDADAQPAARGAVKPLRDPLAPESQPTLRAAG
jgi:flagellar motor switch protein FliM